jgi:hypothetical protein
MPRAMPNKPKSKSKIFITAVFSKLWQKFRYSNENDSNAKKPEKHVDNLKDVHIFIYVHQNFIL